MKYSVKVWGGGAYVVEAENSTKAKQKVCKMLGRSAAAPLVGIKGMTATKIEGEKK